MTKKIFFTIGIPGSGKSTFAFKFSQKLGATYIGGDIIAHELFNLPRYTEQEMAIVFQEMLFRAEDGLYNSNYVVLDGGARTEKKRSQIIAFAERHHVEAIGVWVRVSPELSRERSLSLRSYLPFGVHYGRQLTKEKYEQYICEFEEPRENKVVTINGDEDFSKQYSSLQKQLASLTHTSLT